MRLILPPMTFGKRLKTIRKKRGLTQRELGRRAAFTQVYVAQLEAGASGTDLKVRTVKRLAKALRVPVIDLLAGV